MAVGNMVKCLFLKTVAHGRQNVLLPFQIASAVEVSLGADWLAG
jgi:hypothetical protein